MVLTGETGATDAPSQTGVASAAFGIDELVALAGLLGASRFPGVPDAAFSAMTPQARDAALRAARRGLVAHGVVGFAPDGSPTLAPGYDELIATPLTAQLVVAVERRDASTTQVRHFYTRPNAAVEHGVAMGNIHRLARLEPSELAARVFELTGLEKRKTVDAPAFSTTAAAFTALRDGVRTGDLSEARESLGSEGRAFADAMADFKAWCMVRVLRHEDGKVEGGDTTWIDAGDVLWRVEAGRGEATQPAPGTVEVAPTSAAAIVDEVLTHLTGEGSGRATV